MKIKLQNHVVSQCSLFSLLMDQSLLSLSCIWSTVQNKMSKNISNCTFRYMNNLLLTRKHLAKWGISPTSECSFCLHPETLLPIVAGCKSYLDHGRFTWRHDSILQYITQFFKAAQGIKLFSDLPGYLSLSIISADDVRPDLILLLPSNSLYVSELTIGYESNFSPNSIGKEQRYRKLLIDLKSQYKEVFFLNLSMGEIGVMNRSSTSFLDVMKEFGFDDNTRKFIIK